MQTLCRVIGVTLLLLVAFNIPLKAQNDRNNGFIGVGLGPGFLPGQNEVKAGAGLHLNLLNVGYTLGKGFGVTGTWAGQAHAFDTEVTDHSQGNNSTIPAQAELSYGALMIGPMYTLNLANNASLDFKLRLGSLYTSEKITSETVAFTSESRSLGASLGVGYRRKIANRWCLMLSSDYYAGKQQFSFAAGQSTQILSFTAGVGFVL